MAWLSGADLTGRMSRTLAAAESWRRQQCVGGISVRDLAQARSTARASDPEHLGAGKSSLLDAILRFVPEEDRIVYSAMTGQSLFYMGELDLKHKLLAIAEEQGATRASYALKLLQSEGELTIASTSKDMATGKLETQEYRVEGPVMIALTTTAAEIDEELLNRCLVLTIDEGRAQTQAIHAAQRERRTLAGLLAKAEREAILKTHQDAQRLIEPLAVVNPYAHKLTFLDDRTRSRRDHEKYLTLIDAIALLHQHQRVVRRAEQEGQVIRYVQVTLEDIALANALAHEILGRTLDELPPQTRRLLGCCVRWSSEPAPSSRSIARSTALAAALCASTPAGATRSLRSISRAWLSSSTCSCIAAAVASRSSTSCYTTVPRTAMPRM